MSWYKPRRTLKSVADELAEGLGNGTIALSEVAEGTSVEPEVELLEDPFQRVPLNWGMSREEWELVTSHSVDRPEEEHIDNPLPHQSQLGQQASINNGLTIKGEVVGTESVFIDGKVEGMINIPGNRVTIGKNGVVNASISAREIIVLGKVKGNVIATDRVDIRAEGSLIGDVIAVRISIEDSAFFQGGIELRKPEIKYSSATALDEATRMA
jgi:cytoskeletal protein CcmA (bactofilin family)